MPFISSSLSDDAFYGASLALVLVFGTRAIAYQLRRIVEVNEIHLYKKEGPQDQPKASSRAVSNPKPSSKEIPLDYLETLLNSPSYDIHDAAKKLILSRFLADQYAVILLAQMLTPEHGSQRQDYKTMALKMLNPLLDHYWNHQSLNRRQDFPGDYKCEELLTLFSAAVADLDVPELKARLREMLLANNVPVSNAPEQPGDRAASTPPLAGVRARRSTGRSVRRRSSLTDLTEEEIEVLATLDEAVDDTGPNEQRPEHARDVRVLAGPQQRLLLSDSAHDLASFDPLAFAREGLDTMLPDASAHHPPQPPEPRPPAEESENEPPAQNEHSDSLPPTPLSDTSSLPPISQIPSDPSLHASSRSTSTTASSPFSSPSLSDMAGIPRPPTAYRSIDDAVVTSSGALYTQVTIHDPDGCILGSKEHSAWKEEFGEAWDARREAMERARRERHSRRWRGEQGERGGFGRGRGGRGRWGAAAGWQVAAGSGAEGNREAVVVAADDIEVPENEEAEERGQLGDSEETGQDDGSMTEHAESENTAMISGTGAEVPGWWDWRRWRGV